MFSHTIVIDGRVAGTWRRTLTKQAVTLECNTFMPLAPAEQRALATAADQYGAFLGISVTLQRTERT